MESVVGCVGKDFVLLGADMKAARSILTYKSDDEKMLALDEHKVITGNGPQADRKYFFEFIQKNMKVYELEKGVSLNGHAAANFTRNQLASSLRSQTPYQVNLLIGAFDKKSAVESDSMEDGTPSLYWMDYLGAMAKVNFGAHGYGANFVLSVFDRMWHENLTLEEAMKIMSACRHELETRFLVKSGKWEYQVVDADGIRTVEIV